MISLAGVALIVFNADDFNHVALGRRIKQEGYGNWVNCGGKIETGEDPADAVKRECGEEFGFVPDLVYPQSFTWVREEGKQPFLMLYFATAVKQQQVTNAAPHEFDCIGWFDVRPSLKYQSITDLQMWTRDALAIQRAHQYMIREFGNRII